WIEQVVRSAPLGPARSAARTEDDARIVRVARNERYLTERGHGDRRDLRPVRHGGWRAPPPFAVGAVRCVVLELVAEDAQRECVEFGRSEEHTSELQSR